MVEEGQFAANIGQLIEDKAYFIVPANNYDVRYDKRLLIPFMMQNKIGFVNQWAEPIVEPLYDIVSGNILSESDILKVGIFHSYGFTRPNGYVQTYNAYKYGILDSKGNLIFKCEHSFISVSDDNKLFVLKSFDREYCVVDRKGNVIVPYGKYSLIDGYTKGYARVKLNGKWGIIDSMGNIVLPVEYDEIWNFHTKTHLNYTRVVKKPDVFQFNLNTGNLISSRINHKHEEREEDTYGSHYGEFSGTYAQDVMDYSDDVINDAFEGDPDAYWNID